jgi:hypothetical protein
MHKLVSDRAKNVIFLIDVAVEKIFGANENETSMTTCETNSFT